MARRFVQVVLLVLFLSTPLAAQVEPCSLDGNCAGGGGGGGGGGSTSLPPHCCGPINPPLPFSVEEPYRNADVNPLGVMLSTGEFQINVTDLEIPGRGFPFRLTRTYRSKRDLEGSFLGFNWHLGYDEYLKSGYYMDANDVSYAALEWTMGDGHQEVWVQWWSGYPYVAFNGFFGRIRELTSGAGWQIRYADGTVKTFGQSVRFPDGVAGWRLTAIEDRNGNRLTIQFYTSGPNQGRISTITDTLGRKITFGYDGGRLTSVSDFKNRQIDYHYDASWNLDWVKAPEVKGTPTLNDFCESSGCSASTPRKKTTYTYSNTLGCAEPALIHNLISIKDAMGQTFLENRYFSQADLSCGTLGAYPDTVALQLYGGQLVRYDYAPIPAPTPPGPNDPASQTTITDRKENIQRHVFNKQGNPLRIEYQTNRGVRFLGGGDEPDYVETNTYVEYQGAYFPMLVAQHTESGGFNVDASGNLVPYSGGMTVDYVYDVQPGIPLTLADPFRKGNLLSVTKTAGPRGGAQASITTTYTYEPVFNQPVTIMDPRGHVTTLTYDFQEGTYEDLVAGTPPPAPLDPAWWPSTNVVQVFMEQNGSRGDLINGNGDGYHRGGSLIRVSEGRPTGYDGAPGDEITTTYAYNDFGLPMIRRDAELNETRFLYFSEKDPDGDGTNTPSSPDGRTLSAVQGSAGGGYLKQKVLDATPTMPLSTRPPGQGRESGQNPTEQSISLVFSYDPVGNIKSMTDGRGIRADYVLNALNQIVQVTHAAASTAPGAPSFSYQEQFIFDANDNVVQHKTERRDDGTTSFPATRRWTTMSMTYDTLDRKVTETLTTDDTPAINLTTSYAYDANGNLTQTVFPAGNAVLRSYDERDLLYREVVLKSCAGASCTTYDPAVDSVVQYDYDGSGNLIQLTDPEGHVARTGYDGFNRRVVGFDPALQKTTLSYDPGGNLLEQATFGSLGGPTPTGAPEGGYPELSRQRLYYDEQSRLRRTDTKFFKYSGNNQTPLAADSNAGLASAPTGEALPAIGDGWITSLIKYDRLGRVVKTTDDNGHFTETRYDGLSRKLKVFLNPVAPFSDISGTVMDERNAVEYQYDADGNLTRTIETERGLDRSGGTTRKLTTLQQYQTDFRYDSMNRRVETKLVGKVGASPLNHTTTVVYDSRGNKIQVTDPAGGRTKLTYDGLNRLLRTESGYFWNGTVESIPANLITTGNPDGKITTTYTYDANNRLTSLQDDNGRTTSFIYDNLNRRSRVTYPDNTYRHLTYDRDSLATIWEHFKANGSTDKLKVTTSYDALHRAIQKDVDNSLASYFIGTKRQLFEYDGAGRMTRAVDDLNPADALVESEVRLAYNSLGKVISEDQVYAEVAGGGPVSTTNSVTSVFNGVGFRAQITYPNGRTVTFAPDELNRLDTLNDSYTGSTKYDYLGPGRILNRIYPNGTKLTMLSGSGDNVGAGYDDARRVVDWASKSTAATPAVLSEFTYGYDAANNRLYERRVHQPSGSNWKGERYTYDAVYRLINRSEGNLNASGVLQGTPLSTQDFNLDGLGNWTSYVNNGTSYPNAVNNLNQYTAFQGPLGTRNLTYDFAGNLTGEGTGGATYAYDFANRLVTYRDAAGLVTTYRYDALGRRISKNVSGATLTRFVYDGDRMIEERDAANAPIASYVHGIGSNEVLTRRWWTGGTAADLFYHTNALGSVTAVTDASGAVVERYQYDAYGKPTFLSPAFGVLTRSTVFNTILFTGQYLDPESGNYYYRSRTYHPYLGRFLQRDPLGEAASLNLYSYVFNNPVNATDPTGMWTANAQGRAAGILGQTHAMSTGSTGWSLQQKMEFRRGHFVNSTNAEFSGYEEAQAAEDYYSELEREQAERDAKAARVAAVILERLRRVVKDLTESMKDPLNQGTMNSPGGVQRVIVNILGLGQDATQELSGGDNHSNLDEYSQQNRQPGDLVLTVSGDHLASLHFSETSQDAVRIITTTIVGIVSSGGSSAGNGVEVQINAFSRGGGGAVVLANQLTASGGVRASDIRVNLIDPYVGCNANRINSADVHVNLFTTTDWGFQRLGPIIGLHREVFQGPLGSKPLQVPSIQMYNVPHTQMDSYPQGALGSPYF